MKIGIDARMLGPKQGGIGRYVEQLIRQLSAETNGHTFVVFLRKENWNLVEDEPHIKKILANFLWYGWREQILLPGIINKEKIDLMHFPHWNIPLFYNKPFVVTIHDLLLLHFPTRAASALGPISYFIKNIAYRIILRHAIRDSKHVFAPSEFTKQDIIKTFGLKRDKITVTPLGISDFQSTSNATADKYKIIKPFVLYVGVAYPHKNLDGLIEAWKIFCGRHGDNYELVLTGKINYFYEKIMRLAEKKDIHNITFTGFVPDEDLPTLYRSASLYIFPSLYEGFGLPPLEAMQYGLPVASSNAACLPEILRDAVLYFDPRNSDDIADTIWRGLTDRQIREQLNQKSVQLIHNFSWKNTANATLEGYKNVL